jgi:hypothetical protein
MGEALIRFVCIRMDHRPQLLSVLPWITIYDGSWAYCPAGLEREHSWHTIEPVTRRELAQMRWSELAERAHQVA